jgi:hypothetical protein
MEPTQVRTTLAKEVEVPLFRRRRDEDDLLDDGVDLADPADGAAEADDVDPSDGPGDVEQALLSPASTAAPPRPAGPWDAADVQDDVERLDLGALHVPVPDGCEVRVDVQDDQVVAATLVDGRSAIQIHAFAAPRTQGIWDEVRAEIAESLNSSGGAAEDVDGPFGRELRARIPAAVEGQTGVQLQPARFVGVDGPRWFLRGLITGAAATDRQQAGPLEGAFRGVVVVRGGEAMAPRDLLPLRLPKEALAHLAETQAAQEQPDAPQRPTLDTLERGPEITETR